MSWFDANASWLIVLVFWLLSSVSWARDYYRLVQEKVAVECENEQLRDSLAECRSRTPGEA